MVAARLALAAFPFRASVHALGAKPHEGPVEIPEQHVHAALEVGRSIRLACRLWRPLCLVRSLAAMAMLRRRGLHATLYLGLAREGSSQMRAHAWVRCGVVFVVGGRLHGQYTVVGCFTPANPPLS